jgi:hypothetical protein
MCEHGQERRCWVLVAAADSHDGRSRWAVKAVDACLADKVNALNAIGLLTRSCCCGHGKGGGEILLHNGTRLPAEAGQPPDNLRRTVRHFRVLRGWKIRMVGGPNNHGSSCGGRANNRFNIGTWDCKFGPQPPDYILHEVLHAAVIAVVKMDKRKPKEQRQAEELLVQDLCRLIMPKPRLSSTMKA